MLDFDPEELDRQEIMERLKRAGPVKTSGDLPERLPVKHVITIPMLFQPRGGPVDEHHVGTLAKTVKQGRKLDPILVLQIGDTPILIDGHHRLDGQRSVNPDSEIDVTYFEGTVEEAVLESGKLNSRAKLPMTNAQRMDYAWRLVRIGTFTKRQITLASSVSDGQVATMRRTMKELGESAEEHDQWFQAWNAAKGKDFSQMTEKEIEDWKESRAEDYAERLSKAFGSKLVEHPEIAAMSLARHFGRRTDDLAEHILTYASDDDEEEEEENDDF